MSGHTPAPWVAEAKDDDTCHNIWGQGSRHPIAKVQSYWTGEAGLPDRDTRAANAALIAAAPELLEAARSLRLVLRLAALKYDFDLADSETLAQAGAAISKATGGE